MVDTTSPKTGLKEDSYAYLRHISPALAKPYLKEVLQLAINTPSRTTRKARHSKKDARI